MYRCWLDYYSFSDSKVAHFFRFDEYLYEAFAKMEKMGGETECEDAQICDTSAMAHDTVLSNLLFHSSNTIIEIDGSPS